MKEKPHKSVILFSEWRKPLQALSLEQKGQLLDAILDFPEGITPEFDDPLLLMAWAFIEGPLKNNAEKWNEIREKRREAAKKGNEKRWHSDDDSRKNRKCDTCDDDIANVAVTVTDYVTGNVTVTAKDKEISPNGDTKKAASASPSPKSSKNFSPPELEDVKAYFAEKGGTAAQAERFRCFYESNGWKVGKNPMKSWKAAASGWIARDKEREQTTSTPQKKPFMASRPPAEAAAHPNTFMENAVNRRPLKKKGEPNG